MTVTDFGGILYLKRSDTSLRRLLWIVSLSEALRLLVVARDVAVKVNTCTVEFGDCSMSRSSKVTS